MKKKRLFHLRLWGPEVNEGVEWEIEHHLSERIDELMASGRTREEAESEARRTFGDVRRVERELLGIDRGLERRSRWTDLIETALQDVRYGLRSVRLNPSFSATVILTLGLGIGANVALFSVIDALLFRPLPYRAPDELVNVLLTEGDNDRFGGPFEWEQARTWRERQDFFDGVMAHARGSALYTGGKEATRLNAMGVTHEFEETLGIQPMFGRGFLPEDGVPGIAPVVLLDYAFWRGPLGGDSTVVGRTIELQGAAHTVIGVMPKSFKFPEYSTTEVWLPLRNDGTLFGEKRRVYLIGRIPQQYRMTAAGRAIALGRAVFDSAQTKAGRSIRLGSLQEDRARGVALRESIWLLSGAVLLILLIGGVNVINLLLMRGTSRAREVAVRLALGATRARLVRQLATETMTLAILGGLVAVVLAFVALRGLSGIMPNSITFFASYAIELERRALLVTLSIAIACGLIFGLLPALIATARSNISGDGDLTRYASRTRAKTHLRRSLVVGEVALSVTLLFGAALLINSFSRLMAVDPGVELDRLAVMNLEVSQATHPDPGERGEYLRRLEERIEAIPGVSSATLASGLPPRGGGFSMGVALQAEGQPAGGGQPTLLPFTAVRPDFFEVTGARLLDGRAFRESDSRASGSVIIDRHLARYLWPQGSALGRRFRVDAEAPWLTVIGVMADLKLMGPDDRRGNFEIMYPFGALHGKGGYLTFAIRTERDPRLILGAVREAVHQIDPDQPIESLATGEVKYAEAVDMPRFLLVLMTTLAGLALLLAGIGIYGVLEYGVRQRAHELGVRMALGARTADLHRMVLSEGVRLGMIGAGLGLAGAIAFTRLIRSLLYGVDPTAPITLIAVVATMIGVAVVASLQPAWRASRTNPVTVLKAE